MGCLVFCKLYSVMCIITSLTCHTANAAEKNRVREQKLSLEISAAKRERDFYMSKVEQSRALKHMQERRKKVWAPSFWFNIIVCNSASVHFISSGSVL